MALCASPITTRDRIKRLVQLVHDLDVDINCVDVNGNNPLLLLCRTNRCSDLLPCIQSLLLCHDTNRQININHRNLQGWNALLLLCRYHTDENLVDFVRLLIQYGIDSSAKNKDGYNALLLLSRHYNNDNLIEILSLLFRHNKGDFDVNCRTNYGSNCLSLLCRYYNCGNLAEIIRLLISYGININSKNNDMRTPLTILCRFRGCENIIDCARLLIENGADVYCADSNGWNALQFICSNYCRENVIEIVRCLLMAVPLPRKIISWRTQSGITALEAFSRNWSGMLHYLLDELSAGVQLDVQSMGRIILNASLLGCLHSVKKLMLCLSAVPIDVNCKSPFDHLENVATHSFSLCKECSQDSVNEFRKKLESAVRRRLIFIHTPQQKKKEMFNNKITYNDICTYRHESRHRHISVPSFQKWLKLLSAWHDSNTITMKKINHYLDKHSHPSYDNHYVCKWCQVSRDVDDYLFRLLYKVKEIDPLFEIKQYDRYGSSYEKTNIFLPCEFDRIVTLKHFRQSSLNCKQVVYAGTCREADSSLEVNEPINSSSLLRHLTHLVDAAKDSVSSVHIFGPIIGYAETCVTVHFLYRGRHPPAMKASVDISVAVDICIEQSSETVTFPKWCHIPSCVPAFLVPYRRTEGSHWQITYPTVERDLLLRAGDVVARVYQLIKFLFSIQAQKTKQNRKKNIPRNICPSSYAVKTCLIQYLVFHSPPPWDSNDIIRHAIGVLEQYPMNSSEMKSFFGSNVFVYEISENSRNSVSEIISKLLAIKKNSLF